MKDYGIVSSVRFIMDCATGCFKDITPTGIEDNAAAAKAISELDGTEFSGRQVVVKGARSSEYWSYRLKEKKQSRIR